MHLGEQCCISIGETHVCVLPNFGCTLVLSASVVLLSYVHGCANPRFRNLWLRFVGMHFGGG